jgi:alkanesulfonate monooxygenase SsuD/methylene tetrahydromethanopterin reductase-like flavin-dependent oxidoreductase (luciferase family)
MSTLKFGVALPYTSARMVAQLSQLAEQTGWDGCFLGDTIWCEDPMIGLAAAAMTTHRIRLGTMVTPVPLRRPWKLASESLALDHLSDGRLILGLGTGAVWMGWQSFPDEVTNTRARAEMLDECIDILTLLYQRKQFDYMGKHYHLRLTLLDEQYYPPTPVQQPRIPLWVVGVWPRQKSMQRALKGDGLLVEKLDRDGNRELTPADIREIKAYVHEHRRLSTPFDILNGKTADLDRTQLQEKLVPWQEAGVTWWIEGLWDESVELAAERIRRGPPRLDEKPR